jgi:hypothetical protein
MFGYRLHLEDGSDAGEATYAQMIKPGEEIIAGKGAGFTRRKGPGWRRPFLFASQLSATAR